MTPDDEPKAFLETCEQVVEVYQWLWNWWAINQASPVADAVQVTHQALGAEAA